MDQGFDDVVARAAEMRPRLREQQDEHTALGGYGPETHRAFAEAGFYRLLAPKIFGGTERGLTAFLAVAAEISRGDPAVGWNFTLGAGHAYHVASRFPESAQRELLGSGDFIAPLRVNATGHATETADGHRLTGTWGYCSGSTWSTHVLVAATVSTPDGEPAAPRVFAVPRERYQILDDWGGDRTLGMAASGSNSIRIDDVPVPADMSIPYALLMEGPAAVADSPGYRLHGNPTYLGMTGTFFLAELVATQVGAARAALDEYEPLMRTRSTPIPPMTPWIESDPAHVRYGTMLAQADAAGALLLAAADRIEDGMRRWADGGDAFTTAADQRLRGIVHQAGRMAGEVVDTALTTAGTSAARAGSRLARYHRDVTTYRTHALADPDVVAILSSRAELGVPRG